MKSRLNGMLCATALTVGLALAQGAAAELPQPGMAGYRQMLDNRTAELQVFTYVGNPDILVLDIPTLEQQGAMFNRLVTLIERMGAPRDRVLDDAQLDEYIRSIGRTPATFAFGNDFRTSELTVFFNLADHAGIQLNDQELMLRDFLITQGFMAERRGFYQKLGPDRVILSVPQEQQHRLPSGQTLRITPLARQTILRHELSHGEYYANRDYRAYCRRFWAEQMTDADRAVFRKFLGERAYDMENEEMMINETQAYLMHTPDPGAFNPDRFGLKRARIEELRRAFLAGNPPSVLFQDQ